MKEDDVKMAEATLRGKRRSVKGAASWGEKAYTVAIVALEKQLPMDTVLDLGNDGCYKQFCPSCGCSLKEYGYREKTEETDVRYCPECGQRLGVNDDGE